MKAGTESISLDGGDGDDTLLGDSFEDAGNNDTLRGGAGRDFLIGLLGSDALDGGAGADDWAVYDYAPSAVTVDLPTGRSSGGDGADTLTRIEHVSGSEFEDTLRGNATRNVLVGNGGDDRLEGQGGDDILRGSGDDDTLIGGTGFDTASYFDAPSGVVVNLLLTTQDTLGAGIDTFSSVENLNGSEFGDTLTGNSGVNVLQGFGGIDILDSGAGNDTLDGGEGADEMTGGTGNDIYVVDDAGDTVIEGVGGGVVDTVQSSIGYTLGSNIENLTLTGAGDIDGIGNELANIITGNASDNVLDGGIDSTAVIIDQLRGGLGDDTYIVRNANDKVTEFAGQGADTVKSFVTYTLGLNVENLELQGAANINGTGNALGNTLTGNTGANVLLGLAGADRLDGGGGADTLNGGTGNDLLIGGLGSDSFVFNTALSTATVPNIDTVDDFEIGIDKIWLENAIFTKIGATGPLSADFFKIGAAIDANDFVLYNDATGALSYDKDGSGAAAPIQYALLDPGLALTHADILVI